ncbi:MAG: hypothetical protein JW836_12480 [Deltaproteobacteria bacterium]|nr:hypothetical protein [Deltaproteobacteria bacterium]
MNDKERELLDKGEPLPGGNLAKEEKKRLFYHENGKTYFSRSTERLIFFVLTLVVVLITLLARLGVLG